MPERNGSEEVIEPEEVKDEISLLDKFSEYVAGAWLEFEHRYVDKKTNAPWQCTSLRDASNRYAFGGKTREETNRLLSPISDRLRTELRQSSSHCHALHHQCLEILEWGGVEGASSAWLRLGCEHGTLGERLNSATTLLRANGRSDQMSRFDGDDLVMNSGLTKIYSLAVPDEIVIYDGRTGAALGLLAREFCKVNGHKEQVYRCGKGMSAIPTVLQFPWGDGRSEQGSRNPSSGSFRLPRLHPGATRTHSVHAEACRKASLVLRNTTRLLAKRVDAPPSLRDLEMALFMVGYRVDAA